MSSSVLQLAASSNAEDFLRDMRVRSLYSPYFFIKTVLDYRDLVDHLHQHDLELFVTRWSEGHTKQFIEWPRAFFKTTTFTVGVGLWIICPVTEADSEYAIERLGIPEADWFKRVALHDQDATQLYAFEVMENAEKKVGICKWHLEENELFRACFPEIAYDGSERPWNNKCIRTKRVGNRRRDAEGTFEAIGVGGSLQSRHYKLVWEDDLVGEKARKSDAVMSDTIGWHGRLAGCFEDPGNQIRFGVSNRWGYNDLNSYVREKEPDFVFYTRAAWELNSDTGQLESIFPEKYTMEKLIAIRDGNSMTDYDFSCQYLNSPVLPGQQEVDKTKLHYYTVDADGRVFCVKCQKGYYPSQMYRYMRYDPYNAKGAGSTSCPAIVVLGTTADHHVFLIDTYTSKENYNKIYDRLFFYNDTWRPREFSYEDVGHQNLTEHHIRSLERTAEHKAAHRNFPKIVGSPTGGKSKEFRIRQGLFPLIEKKKFGLREVKHQLFLDQLGTFPHKTLGHDYDLLDAASQGADTLRFPQSEDDSIFATAGEDEYLANFNKNYSNAGSLR